LETHLGLLASFPLATRANVISNQTHRLDVTHCNLLDEPTPGSGTDPALPTMNLKMGACSDDVFFVLQLNHTWDV
jgi:hypothetical protein